MEVTPELSDGYEGVVRKLVCLDCRNPFYITKEDYERIHPRYCHPCSLRRIGVERRKTKRPVPKEAVDQAEQAIQQAQAENVKIEDLSPEDKKVLYAVLQDIADELRRIHRERRRQQRLQESQRVDMSTNRVIQGAREACLS